MYYLSSPTETNSCNLGPEYLLVGSQASSIAIQTRTADPSESQFRQGPHGVRIRRHANLAPPLRVRCSRRFGFASVSNRVAARQEMRRQATAVSQPKDHLSHLARIAILVAPVRRQPFNKRAHGRLIVRPSSSRRSWDIPHKRLPWCFQRAHSWYWCTRQERERLNPLGFCAKRLPPCRCAPWQHFGARQVRQRHKIGIHPARRKTKKRRRIAAPLLLHFGF